jgi:hypothetical protein
MNPLRGTGLQEQEPIDSREVDTMAATIDIEIESGVYADPVRLHQGYYAGDFSQFPLQRDSR